MAAVRDGKGVIMSFRQIPQFDKEGGGGATSVSLLDFLAFLSRKPRDRV